MYVYFLWRSLSQSSRLNNVILTVARKSQAIPELYTTPVVMKVRNIIFFCKTNITFVARIDFV